MSEKNDTTEPDRAPLTMGEISHTNPHTGETAGHLFRRGPVIAADGGREAAETDDGRTSADTGGSSADRPDEAGNDGRTMKDVSHTPPNASEDANRAFERGRRPAEDAEE